MAKTENKEVTYRNAVARDPPYKIANGEARLVPQQTLALLRILAMGNREIENGQFHSGEKVFTELDLE